MNDKIVIMIGFFASTVVGIAVMSYPGADPPKRTTEPVITDEKQTSLLRQVDKYEKLVKESLDHLNTFLDEEEPEKVRVCATHSIRDIAEQRKKVLDLREAVATRWANLEPDNQQGVATSLQLRILATSYIAADWEDFGAESAKWCSTCNSSNRFKARLDASNAKLKLGDNGGQWRKWEKENWAVAISGGDGSPSRGFQPREAE